MTQTKTKIEHVDPTDLGVGECWLRAHGWTRDDATDAMIANPDQDYAIDCLAHAVLICDEIEGRGEVFQSDSEAGDDEGTSHRIARVTPTGWTSAR